MISIEPVPPLTSQPRSIPITALPTQRTVLSLQFGDCLLAYVAQDALVARRAAAHDVADISEEIARDICTDDDPASDDAKVTDDRLTLDRGRDGNDYIARVLCGGFLR